MIQFKLFNNPIKLWKNRLQNRKVHIKVCNSELCTRCLIHGNGRLKVTFIFQMTPVNLVRHNSLELQQFGGDCVDDSLSMDTQDIIDQPAFSITEIAVRIT